MLELGAAGLSATMEDYLETIYQLQATHQVARVRDIARQLGVKMPTVSGALKTLAGRGLVEHEAYGYATLTEEGRQLAEQVHDRHTAIVDLLQRVMLLAPEQAGDEACRLEHALSSEALERLRLLTRFMQENESVHAQWQAHLEQAAICEVAPEAVAAAAAAASEDVTLDEVAPGSAAVIVRVCGEGPIRRRLLDMGLRPGAEVRVERLAPLGDPIEIMLLDYHLTLRRSEAVNIRVQIVEQPLSQVRAGRRVQLVSIRGGAGRQRRLAGQGLAPGVELTVLERPPGHQRIALMVGEVRTDIGHNLADDVVVRLL
ncbi:metal-dependent transcriptional regulator [bacterium]|nr:metal-dependent transcriptional regulator [bacterium]